MIHRVIEPRVRSVAFSRDSGSLVTAGADHTVRLWDLRDFTASPKWVKAHEGRVVSLAFSPDNTYLASGGLDGVVRVWNVRNPEVAPISLPYGDTVKSLAFSPNSTKLAGSITWSARVWNLQDPDSDPLLLRDRNGFQSISFSADGEALASFTSFDRVEVNERELWSEPRALRRWDLHTGESETVFQDENLRQGSWSFAYRGPVALSKDWSRLASALGDDKILRVWDLQRRDRPPLEFRGHEVVNLAFAPDSNRLASAGRGFDIRVWDLKKPAADPLVLRTTSVGRLAFSTDNTRLISGGINEVRVWDLYQPDAPPIVVRAGKALINSVAISDDGSYLAMGDEFGSIWLSRLWTAAADYLCTRVSRNLSLKEWQFYIGESIPYERTCPALPDGR